MALTNFSWIIERLLAGSDLPGNGSGSDAALWSDCEYLHSLGVRKLVSLEHPGSSMGRICDALGIDWHYFPIADFGVPVSDRSFCSLIDESVLSCMNGVPVCIHCRAGIGRTGMVLACIYGRFANVDATAAIEYIRRTRTAIETGEQRRFVMRFLDRTES